MEQDEHTIQKTLIRWAELQAGKYPQLHLLHAIPNGGKRNKVTAAKLKAEGVRPGVPDLFLPVPKDIYHGLYLEIKTPTGTVRKAQKQWIGALQHQGYKVEVCRSWHYAAAIICTYLELKISTQNLQE